MIRFRAVSVVAGLFVAAAPAFAQQWGGSGAASPRSRAGAAEPRGSSGAVQSASGGTWDGRQPTWGGSPPVAPAPSRMRGVYLRPYYFIPMAVAAPAPVPAPVIVDTVYVAAAANPFEANVAPPSPPARELTTMEVYRQQRFRRP